VYDLSSVQTFQLKQGCIPQEEVPLTTCGSPPHHITLAFLPLLLLLVLLVLLVLLLMLW
jgi:hypothetical protein